MEDKILSLIVLFAAGITFIVVSFTAKIIMIITIIYMIVMTEVLEEQDMKQLNLLATETAVKPEDEK